MRFVSRYLEAPGCFAAGRAFRGSGFRLRSRLRRLFAPRTTPIPSPSFILFLLRPAIFSVKLYFPVAVGWLLEPPRLTRQDSPRRSQTSCLLPLRRLRSLPATSCGRISKIAAPLLAFFETVRFGSNPVDPALIF